MQFIDLRAQYAVLELRIRERMARVLEHGQFILGPEVSELEDRLARYSDVREVVTCASGTDALWLALRGLGVGPGDAVFTTPFSFFASTEAIELAGAQTVFVDIRPDTYHLDPARLEQALAEHSRRSRARPRAVIAVDLFGVPADYAELEPLCQRHGLDLIEDAAQSFGACAEGRRAGAFGRVAATSFFPSKPLGCYGDGGAVLSGDRELAERLRSLRAHGRGARQHEHLEVGTNSRLDTLQAAVLLEKLDVFDAELCARDRIAERYTKALPKSLVAPRVPGGRSSTWAQYSVLAPNEDERRRLRSGLEASGIPTAVHYPLPLHLQPAFGHLRHRRGDFPVAEAVSERIFSLPMHAYLGAADQDRILGRLRELLPD